jgi:hypothetical protein
VSALLHWAYFLAPSFVSAYIAMFVWGKTSSLGYALVSGTLAGIVCSLTISFLFWDGTDICDQCYQETN